MEAGPDQDYETTQRAADALPQRTCKDSRRAVYRRGLHATLDDWTQIFSHADQWAVFEPVYATVPEHWHRVASDLGENAEDYEQILKTPRMIIGNHEGTISRVFQIINARGTGQW